MRSRLQDAEAKRRPTSLWIEDMAFIQSELCGVVFCQASLTALILSSQD